MTRFSANLGFLWTDLPLTDAVRAATRAGYDAVECHWPYDTPASDLRQALEDTGLPLLSLNTRPGGAGEFGLSALPGREPEARAAIDEALTYAATVQAPFVHVMAGIGGERAVFERNLDYACAQAAARGITILIEALNAQDVPNYHLGTVAQAAGIVRRLGHANLKLMFDCYHVAKADGAKAVIDQFDQHHPNIGHIQIAGVPDRGAPDQGDLAYRDVLRHFALRDWPAPIGAEYRPASDPTEEFARWRTAITEGQ